MRTDAHAQADAWRIPHYLSTLGEARPKKVPPPKKKGRKQPETAKKKEKKKKKEQLCSGIHTKPMIQYTWTNTKKKMTEKQAQIQQQITENMLKDDGQRVHHEHMGIGHSAI